MRRLIPRTEFTVSELDTYATCPMQYRLQYVDRIPSSTVPSPDLRSPSPLRGEGRGEGAAKLTGALLGDVIHATIRKLAERPDADPHATLLATCRQRGCTPSAHDLANATQLIANYCAVTNHTPQTTNHEFIEHPFTLQLNGTTIRGTIDALIKTDEGWDIIDYKTNRIERADDLAELQREYALQMGIYAMAATAARIGPIHSTKLIFLDSGQTIEHEVTPQWLGEIAQQLETIIQKIGSSDYRLPTQFTPPCARCAYHHNATCWEDRFA